MPDDLRNWKTRKLIELTAVEVLQLKETLMATLEQFEAAITAINLGLDGIGADIDSLKEQIAGMGLAGAQEEALLASLTAIADRVTAIDASTPAP